MATTRKFTFATDHYYHLYNRGVEKRPVFTNKREYKRALETLNYYRFSNASPKFSKFLVQPPERKSEFLARFAFQENKLVEIVSFCLMPNHFHFLVKQLKDRGIAAFVSNFTNSYTKYFNTKHERNGPLFTGVFKAVLVETDRQLLHLSRYIHLNPVTSFIIREEYLDSYAWSSLGEYLGTAKNTIVDTKELLSNFSSRDKYRTFIYDQVQYAQELEKIKHLTLEE